MKVKLCGLEEAFALIQPSGLDSKKIDRNRSFLHA
jgi:hypothetical protein